MRKIVSSSVRERAGSGSDETSSSIGEDSDHFQKEEGENEVESVYREIKDKKEAILPKRRGISKFYEGKSKSFTSLSEVSSSAKEIAKPENIYSRRRWELVAMRRGIAKRQLSSTNSHLALAVAIISTNDSNFTNSAIRLRPPRSSWRSYSVLDLHQ